MRFFVNDKRNAFTVLALTRYVLPKVNACDPAGVELLALKGLFGVNWYGFVVSNFEYR